MLPIEGNLCYNPVSSKIVYTSDCSSVDKTTEPLIPFLPYPVDQRTGELLKVDLPSVERRSELRYNAPVFDPTTGLTVPICAVTIHPETGEVHPLGMRTIHFYFCLSYDLFLVMTSFN